MPRDSYTSDDLIRDILANATELGLEGSGNPNSLSAPVDKIDAWIDHYNVEDIPGVPQHFREPEWLPKETHDYSEVDDQPEDPEEIEFAKDTLEFFVNDEGNDPHDPDFEYQFRAFLHNNDYSYSGKTIRHLISSVLGLD